ncbi:unnamed protein product, partial [Owenia fusiformis]
DASPEQYQPLASACLANNKINNDADEIKKLRQVNEELKKQLELFTKKSSECHQDRVYRPRTRPYKPLVKYILVNGDKAPEGHVKLLPNGNIAVPQDWLQQTLQMSKPKKGQPSGKQIIKAILNGLFEPHQLCLKGGRAAVMANPLMKPVYQDLAGYTAQVLKSSPTTFTEAFNEKCATARATVQRLQNKLHKI